jgi:hypothetical protein
VTPSFRRRPDLALVLLPLLLLGGCAREEMPLAVPGPLVRGEVLALDHRATASTVLVGGTPGTGDPCGISATVDGESRVLRHLPGAAREPSTVAQLAVGDTVEVYVGGPVAESCPLQGRVDSLVVVGGGASAGPAHAALTVNTLTRVEGAPRAAATLESVAWIEGHWQGDGLGGTAEEVWAPPLGGTMMGMFRLVRSDSVAFYEILTLEPDGASLILRLKHFHPDLTGWEERDEVVAFALVELAPGEARFDGMTFRRVDADRLDVFVAMGGRDAERREAAFRYHRVGSAAHRAWREGR